VTSLVPRLSTWHCPRLLLSADRSTAGTVTAMRRRLLSIDISCPRDAQQQTRLRPLLLSINGTDRRTDRRTLNRFINPAPHTMMAVWTTAVELTDLMTNIIEIRGLFRKELTQFYIVLASRPSSYPLYQKFLTTRLHVNENSTTN